MEEGDEYGAFIQRFELFPSPRFPSHPRLPLEGLTFAVKDIFDISGYVTGFGNPVWSRTHAAATCTAPAILAVIRAGATCVGKTVMDEMALSVNGENKHYGTPINPCVPDRVPGGSSSGSAVAVAAGLVDFSLGTDTGGSVRVPAAYCGIFGFRPSHGVVSTSNVIPFAQSFDTVGWFARDPSILTRVGDALLQLPSDATVQPTCIIIPEDCFQHLSSLSDKTSHIIINSVEKMFGDHVIKRENLGDFFCWKVPSLRSFMGKLPENQAFIIQALAILSNANRVLQRFEFKVNHGEWLNTVDANFAPERVSEIFIDACENLDCYNTLRNEFQAAISLLLENHGVLVIPTVTGPPPKLKMEVAKLNDFRGNAFRLLCIAGLSRCCQITIPLGVHNNLPVSVSLLARHGADHFLLNLAQSLYGTLREEAIVAWRRPAVE